MNKSNLLIRIFLLWIFTKSALALDTCFENGVAKASLALAISDSVNIKVEVIESPSDFIYRNSYMWGGDETTPPKKIIKSITVFRNSEKFFIPLSAYADLGNPRKISLLKLPPLGFRLIISGGDAAGSYDAMLDFKENEISRKRVVSAEFPYEVWEETVFSFNHLNN